MNRDELASRYLDQLPSRPIRSRKRPCWPGSRPTRACWSAPTGTGKTLIAEAALFEALHTGTTAYYTTPLIALTEQKFREMQTAAVRWGFQPDRRGPGDRQSPREPDGPRAGGRGRNPPQPPAAHRAAVRFQHTSRAVVMDEFHSFTDPERGIVWELTLGLLPPHVRMLLLSATVGNAMDFIHWLRQSHQRELELVAGEERKVPLSYHWIGDKLLTEQLEEMAQGDAETRMTPALVFCFNRDECWTVAEQIKGKKVLSDGQQARLVEELERHDWSQGAGPKLRQLLHARRRRAPCRRCCPSIAASWKSSSSASCSPWPSAPRRWRRASICRPARSWCRAS